ncbi:hypothetical protein CHS0354_032221 [Potamilus streckersoni]|uniref:Uncharacterized protein n=1 Tax=Potamilus streckersoni TaxID=2493646 RepID=A0AAE0RMC0_9BIVA|nr:hypothetical protein CHS0354_032221 [Potamilus streckersoni]
MAKYIVKEVYLTDGQVKKLVAAIAKREQVSLKVNPNISDGVLTKLMLTKNQVKKYDRKRKTFILNWSAAQITAMANDIVVKGGFLGPALSVLACTIIPKVLPVLGTLGLAANIRISLWRNKESC